MPLDKKVLTYASGKSILEILVGMSKNNYISRLSRILNDQDIDNDDSPTELNNAHLVFDAKFKRTLSGRWNKQ